MRAELESLLGDDTLLPVPEKGNGVDELRFILMVSQVRGDTRRSVCLSVCFHL